MFAYCLNNPVVLKDSMGSMALTAVAGAVVVTLETLLTVSLVALTVALIASPRFQRLVSESVFNLTETTDDVIEKQKVIIEEKLTTSLAKAKKPSSKYHVHHIVAQTDKRAAPARYVLEQLFPSGVNSSINLVLVKQSVHQRLHTNAYFNTVNYMIMQAYISAGLSKANQIKNVTDVLLSLQLYINSLNALSPD